MPYPGLLHPELLHLWEAVDDLYLCRRPQTLKGRSGSVSVGPPVAHKVLFEPSEHLWRIWGLILNVISLLLPFAGSSSLPLDVAYLLLVGFNIFL